MKPKSPVRSSEDWKGHVLSRCRVRRRHGLEHLLEHDYDLLILDITFPRLDGLGLIDEIRHRPISTPLLLLTARVTVADKVAALDLGADDYRTKPFVFEELARVRALLRRSASAPVVLAAADLRLDPPTREVTRGGELGTGMKNEIAKSRETSRCFFLLRRADVFLGVRALRSAAAAA